MIAALPSPAVVSNAPVASAFAEDAPAPSDKELFARIARGHGSALAALYDRHSQLLLALALRILRNRQDAEEVMQETFLYVWKRARDYDPDRSSVTSWLVLIARSRSLDRLRKQQRFGQMQLEYRHEEPSSYAAAEGFRQVLAQERAERVRQAIARLPRAQQQILELSFYRGWTQKQVAARIGVPLGTVKTRTYLAMKKLRRELSGELEQLM